MGKGRISRSRKGQGEGRICLGPRTDLGQKPQTSDVIPADESVSRWKDFLRKVVPEKLARSFRKVPWSRYGDTPEVDSAKATQLPPRSLSRRGHARPRASTSSRTLSSALEPMSPESNAPRISESPSGGLNLSSEPRPLTGHASTQALSGSRTLSIDGETLSSEATAPRICESPSGGLDLPSEPASLDVSRRQTVYFDCETTPPSLEELGEPEPPSDAFRLDNQLSAAQDIVVRLPGDDPSRKRLMVASLDTQCKGLNLMSSEAWARLNEEGRGVLESAGDAFVRNLGPHRIRVFGVVRGLEWHFKNGYRTYTDDFHVIDMRDFDVLIGSECIYRNRLLEPGPDLRHHMEMDAEDGGNGIYMEVNSPEH